jgi:hypothetical protein
VLTATALLSALTGLLVGLTGLVRLLVLLTRLLLAATSLLLSTFAALLVLLSALILIVLGHCYLQLKCELCRERQIPAEVFCSFKRNIQNLLLCRLQKHLSARRAISMAKTGYCAVEVDAGSMMTVRVLVAVLPAVSVAT